MTGREREPEKKKDDSEKKPAWLPDHLTAMVAAVAAVAAAAAAAAA